MGANVTRVREKCPFYLSLAGQWRKNIYEPSVETKLVNVCQLKASVKRGAKNVLSSVSPSCSPLKKNIFRQINVHAMYCSFEQRFGVLSSLFIRTVVVDLSAFLRINYFPVLNTLCERSALPRWQIVFWFDKWNFTDLETRGSFQKTLLF